MIQQQDPNMREREERFKRIATKRTNDIMNRIRILGNCANKSAYKYLEESISQFPNQNVLLSKLNQIGFQNTSMINLAIFQSSDLKGKKNARSAIFLYNQKWSPREAWAKFLG